MRHYSTYAAIALTAISLATFTAVGAADETGAAVVPGTPCTATAEACVDLGRQQAWLLTGGRVVRGPVPISSGGPGRETPTGTFGVEWKHIDHVSGEFGTPMPYSVFFAPGGIAFHEGPIDHPSAGCIRLPAADAPPFFDTLQVGDEVQVR
ncbi:L,D-transpeptidase [Pseudonocardia petroleophila]|uniref:L,D-transpeptidase n=1 Tax=Pseudonocardia petroleophila TaxID=37331 RepID=A0A7G7MGX5_9PSEU|nr:L,D-transpeptidase [Pseudonocardia petroleophila]QNG52036.1 L,D-transpeptidase [Pseudonocardia petroleophila]